MTTPPFQPTDIAKLDDAAFEAWVTALGDDDEAFDHLFNSFESLALLLRGPRFLRLCQAYDLCPIHHTDLDTCRDDELGCDETINIMTADGQVIRTVRY